MTGHTADAQCPHSETSYGSRVEHLEVPGAERYQKESVSDAEDEERKERSSPLNDGAMSAFDHDRERTPTNLCDSSGKGVEELHRGVIVPRRVGGEGSRSTSLPLSVAGAAESEQSLGRASSKSSPSGAEFEQSTVPPSPGASSSGSGLLQTQSVASSWDSADLWPHYRRRTRTGEDAQRRTANEVALKKIVEQITFVGDLGDLGLIRQVSCPSPSRHSRQVSGGSLRGKHLREKFHSGDGHTGQDHSQRIYAASVLSEDKEQQHNTHFDEEKMRQEREDEGEVLHKLAPCPSVTSTGTGAFESPQETVIFLDWDDTLFPTWWLMEIVRPCTPGFTIRGECPLESSFAETLRAHGEQVRALLHGARALGTVAIVTLSKHPWIEQSCEVFFGQDWANLCAGGLEDVCVLYARDVVDQKMRKSKSPKGRVSRVAGIAKDPEEEEMEWLDPVASDVLNMQMKERAMSRFLKKTYGRDRSWKNVISIGDSNFERAGLQEAIMQHVEPGGSSKVSRCKTVKLMAGPSQEQLSGELICLSTWLRAIVAWDGDLDFDVDDSDETLFGLHERFGGDAAFNAEEGCSPNPE